MANGGVKEQPAMQLRISGMPDGEQQFSFESTASELEMPRFDGAVTVAGTLRKVSTQFFVQGESRATFVGECDRCLAEVLREVTAPLNLFYQVSAEARGIRQEESADVLLVQPDQDSIVLDDEVRQSLLLEVPLKILCADDCRGICAGCGVNLNTEKCLCEAAPVDPRWAKLAELYKKDENE